MRKRARLVVVFALIPDAPGWDAEKGVFSFTFFGEESYTPGPPRPGVFWEDAIPTHPGQDIPVFESWKEAMEYAISRPVQPAAVPAGKLPKQLLDLAGFRGLAREKGGVL